MAIKTKAQILAQSNTTYIDNTVGSITPASVRSLNDDWIDSIVFSLDSGSLTVATSSVALTSIVTASFDDQTDTLTFTKGNGTTFSILIPDISGSLPISTGSLLVTASIANSTITFTKGDSSTFSIIVNNVVNATSASFATTASYALNAGTSINTGSFATTGSNTFIGNQTIQNGNLTITGSLEVYDAILTQQLLVDGSGVTAPIQVNTPFVKSPAGDLTLEASTGANKITVNNDVSAIGQSIIADSFTGSLSGNATSATSASFATTASFLLGSVQSASFATTASYVLNAVSASFAETASIARNLVVKARNGSASTLVRGTVVHITSAVGDNPIFTTASFNNEALSANTLGVLAADATSGTDVDVVVNGIVTGVDTDPGLGYVAGDIIYLSSSGQFTKVQPQAPDQVVVVGQVLRAQQNNGSIYVNISNGWELDELHNVRITSVSYGDLLVNSGSLWINSKQLTGSYGLTGSLNGGILNVSEVTASNALITNNLRVQGTASFAYTQTITGSAVIIGDQFIVLNANPPLARYAGIQVYDSGSALTASFEWDGNSDNWIVVEETGLSAGILTGPTGSKGSEVFPSANTLIKGSGHHTVSNSSITDDGTVVKINEDTQITGSVSITGSGLFLTETKLSILPKGRTSVGQESTLVPTSIFLQPYVLATATALGYVNYITESFSSTQYGGNYINYVATNAATGSILISGSQNILNLTSGVTNSTYLQGRRGGINGNQNIIYVVPQITGSNTAVLPTVNTSFIVGSTSITNNLAGSGLSLTNANLNGTTNINSNSGSTSLSNVQSQATLTVTNNWSGSTVLLSNAAIVGNAVEVTTANLSTAETGGTTNTLRGIFGGMSTGTDSVSIHMPSGSIRTTGGGLHGIAVGTGLNLTGSIDHAVNQLQRRPIAFFGAYNTNDGIIDSPKHVRFGIGTGTTSTSRRTSLYVSASGETVVSGSLIAVAGVTGSLLGTGSWANNAISSSYALTASFATTASYALEALSSSFASTASFYQGTVNTASFASTASFINPLNQTVIITGSVQANVVSSSLSSNTSSLDFSTANFFTSLVSGSTFFNITNVKAGQTVNVLLTTAGVATASFSSNVKQTSGSVYMPTSGSNKKDILTFASWDNSDVYLVSVKNLI